MNNIENRHAERAGIADLRLDKSVAIRGAKVTVMLDIYNLLNANTVTNFFLTSGATYNTIIAALNPRTTQIAVRLAF